MIEISIPKLNNTDVSGILVEWLFPEGDTVPAGSAIAVVETTKAANDIECEAGGILHRIAETGQEYRFGEPIGYLFADEEELAAFRARTRQEAAPIAETAASTVFSRAAKELLERAGIGLDAFDTAGKKVIKSSDVELFLAERARKAGNVQPVHELSRLQQGIGRVVTESARTIPAASVVVKIGMETVLTRAAGEPDGEEALWGIPEAVIAVLARARDDFPLFFSSLRQDGATAELATSSNVGVTLDAGSGLRIPVIRNADKLSLDDVADAFMEYRMKSVQGTYTDVDLSDGNITLSLHHDTGVVTAQPIVFPGQTCIVTLGGPQSEVVLDGTGSVGVSRYVHLGISYDHRVVNGRDAVLLGQHLKRSLEDTDTLRRIISGGA